MNNMMSGVGTNMFFWISHYAYVSSHYWRLRLVTG